jgi:hypothetical protein
MPDNSADSIRAGAKDSGRRSFLQRAVTAAAGLPLLGAGRLGSPSIGAMDPKGPVDIGSRRELFIDDWLIERLGGGAASRLHHPQPREIVMVHDAPWEGSGSGYHSVFRDGPLYRMYYKAWHLGMVGGKVRTDAHPLYCCYAESDDGIRWRKPALGLHDFRGSQANNIVIASGRMGSLDIDAGHPAVFLDENPAAPPAARYKAFVRSATAKGLIALQSPDGLHWTPMADRPVITDGAFDSQNLAFWDPVRHEYRAYWRIFTAGSTDPGNWKPAGFRAIRTARSDDFLHWTAQADLGYEDSPPEHLYTNQVKPYARAPHILIGFPARYVERGWNDSMQSLPEPEHRRQRSATSNRYGMALTEGLLMASRDGVTFRRWNEAFLRPGMERPGTWHYGHQYIAWHLVETRSDVPGAPDELSLYASESYWTGESSEVRRYTLRLDGFVSIHAPYAGGELLTRPIIFSGRHLELNFATSAVGEVRVELRDMDDKPLPGYSLDDCQPLFGDTVARTVSWKDGRDLSALAGRPLRLRFVLKDADLFSMRFRD